ncbi:GDSL-type esterase/lipase family protein [Flavobacterium sp. W22_SRS_FK3]|uniref:GDSL-type esterase/lipase family protein n=1 Tax=Flavobacterium sp. W22_SRS_FK3 TaxID=3240275 RepID=UPI003F8DAAD7
MKKKLLLLFYLLCGFIHLNGQTLNQSFYVDFGPTGGTQGAITLSPDASGHYWNNMISEGVGSSLTLINANNITTGFKLEVTDNFTLNSTVNYGPSVTMAANLDDLAIGTATQDYFFVEVPNPTGQLKIRNLSPTKGYKFTVFGSRVASGSGVRESKFVFTGGNSFTGQLITTDGSTGNITTMLKTILLLPDASGVITIDLSIVTGNFAYINALKMEEYDIPVNQSMYVDFGPTGGNNGAITPSPDANNHHWNNPTNGSVGATTALINANNVATGYTITVTDNFSINSSDSYGLLTPTTANLADLAVKTATSDYFYLESGNPTGQLKISNLSPSKGYKFNVFGSRVADPPVRESKFIFTGKNSFTGQLVTTDGAAGNNNTIISTNVLFPNLSGEIIIDLSIISGGFAYINALKIEEFEIPVINVNALQITGNNIITSGQTSQLSVVVTPSNASSSAVSWKVDNTNIATITSAGLLSPVGNGAVVVTATSLLTPSVSATKTINVSNQISELFFSGTATEKGDNMNDALPMRMVRGLTNNITNIFEIYTSLKANGTINFYTSKSGGAFYGAGSGGGALSLNGAGIDPAETGTVLITVNLNTNTYSIVPIRWAVASNMITGSWAAAEGAPLDYQGNGIWSKTIDMTVSNGETDTRFSFKGNGDWPYSFHKVTNTANTVMLKSEYQAYNVPTEDIALKYGKFKITLDLSTYTYSIECDNIDDLEISVMGSSVANGHGATDNHGYAYQYAQLLGERFSNGTSSKFTTSNIAINGNNTISLLNRYEKDLIGDCSKYVIYGLSLGNEGIHENGQPAFDQFKANMLLLIAKAKQNGKIPVVMNNYTREDYNAADYNFIKQMNLLIHEWDVPSINLLGAIDNGAGRWATGYKSDDLHPNDVGHTEFFYAMVPSLFDALEQGKSLPKIVAGTPLNINNILSTGSIKFTPEKTIHSFTTSFDVKISSIGNIASFSTATTAGIIAIDKDGHLIYTSPSGTKITGSTVLNDNQWHKITLTHFYARGTTVLYSGATLLGSLNEKLEAKMFSLNPANAPTSIQYKNWFFYRSGMNLEEVTALNNGNMLKSSLELYAPLDGGQATGDATFANLAQSTNKIDFSAVTLKTIDFNSSSKIIQLYPNPVHEILTIDSGDNDINKIEVYNALGGLVKTVIDSKIISAGSFTSGVYILKIFYSDSTISSYKIMKK